MHEPQTHAVKIAVIEEQISGLREQHKSHSESTNKRLDKIDCTLGDLCNTLNRGKGAYAMFIAISGVLGALILKVFGAIFYSISRL